MTDQTLMHKNWIYSLADYRQIFDLTEHDLQKQLLDFPAGVSSVNAELSALGYRIISADPAYSLNPVQMQQFVQENFLKNRNGAENPDIIEKWKRSTELFLNDYETGKHEGRYIPMQLPPQAQIHQPCELLLCPDLLFNPLITSSYEPSKFMNDLAKLAAEVRVYPLPEDKNAVTSALGPLMLELQHRNFGVEIKAIEWLQRNKSGAMLRVWAKECAVSQ